MRLRMVDRDGVGLRVEGGGPKGDKEGNRTCTCSTCARHTSGVRSRKRGRVCESIWETVASPQPSTAQMKFGYQCSTGSKRIISFRPLCTPRPTPSHFKFNDAHTQPSTPHQQQVRPSTCPVCYHLNLTIMDIVPQTVYTSELVSAPVTVSPSPATHSAVERLQEKRDGHATSGHASRDGT